MRKRNLLVGSVILVGLGIAWYVFRPELLFIDSTVDEAFPSSPATAYTVLAKGSFHSVAHESKGMAAIYRLGDGRRVLRFTEFETSNGPDVHVYLVAATDATNNQAVLDAGFIELGSLKGNKGDQNYELPAEVDLHKYRSATIWCRRFQR